MKKIYPFEVARWYSTAYREWVNLEDLPQRELILELMLERWKLIEFEKEVFDCSQV